MDIVDKWLLILCPEVGVIIDGMGLTCSVFIVYQRSVTRLARSANSKEILLIDPLLSVMLR